ncbi:hypothetical protein [Sphingomonas faeni]|uniref:CIS tube protein n=1 Tax=Sphingomonas faeni TaxID=185950 RepID=UPI00334C7731
MARGYLASWLSLPPLVFRFQFNPESMTEKKSYKYTDATNFGNWAFDKTSAAMNSAQPWYTKLATAPAAAYKDLQEIGPQLVRTHPVQAGCGDHRIFSLDFVIDGGVPLDGATAEVGNRYDGSIEPDLAILRSFVNPGVDAGGLIEWFSSGFETTFPPPQCTLIYGGINADCVMESLSIKMTRFNPDTSPARAEVSVTLKQQTKAITPMIETIERTIRVAATLARPGYGGDYANVIPGVSAIKHIFDL